MLDSPEQIEAMFPKLDGGQIARLATFGRQQNAPALEIILERGDSRHGIFVVLSGSIEVIRVTSGGETVLSCPRSRGIHGGREPALRPRNTNPRQGTGSLEHPRV